MAVATTPALADPLRMRVENLTTGVGVVLTDTDGDGILTLVSGAIPGFTVTVVTGTSIPPLPGGGQQLDLNLVVVASGAGSLRVVLENDDYLFGALATASVGGVLTAPAGSSVNVQSWLNPDNLVPELGPDVGAPVALVALGSIPAGSLELFGPGGDTFGPGAFASSESTGFAHAGPYSLFARGVFTFTGAGSASISETQSVPAPEPATLVLLGVGLLGLAVVGLLRRRRAA